jgi:hypothetical protein
MLCVESLPVGSTIGGSASGAVVSTRQLPAIIEKPSCASSDYVLVTKSEFEVPAPSPARLSEISDVFLLFLAALVVIWGSKQLLKLFTGDIEK